MDKELENMPDFDAAESSEIIFNTDFTVSEVRGRAISAQKHKLMKAYPKALLYCILMMVPMLLLFILGTTRLSASLLAGRTIQVIALLFPLIYGGSLFMGIMSGALDISRGSSFKVKKLFFAFTDKWFFKAIGAHVIFLLSAILTTFVFLLPAAIVSALSSGLGDGFAAIATQVIIIMLYIAGILLSAQLYLRLALIFPLLIEHPEMTAFKAAMVSIKAMKGQTWKLFALLLSYIGWFILSFGISVVIVIAGTMAGYFYLLNVIYTGDIYTAYTIYYFGIIAIYLASYLLCMISLSTFIMRPVIGLAVFYDTITCYEPPAEPDMPAETQQTLYIESGITQPDMPEPSDPGLYSEAGSGESDILTETNWSEYTKTEPTEP